VLAALSRPAWVFTGSSAGPGSPSRRKTSEHTQAIFVGFRISGGGSRLLRPCQEVRRVLETSWGVELFVREAET
jgi:hypothetical protein